MRGSRNACRTWQRSRLIWLAMALILIGTACGTDLTSILPPTPTPIPPAFSSDLRAVTFVDKMTGWAVGENHVILKTTDGGKTWTDPRERPAWD